MPSFYRFPQPRSQKASRRRRRVERLVSASPAIEGLESRQLLSGTVVDDQRDLVVSPANSGTSINYEMRLDGLGNLIINANGATAVQKQLTEIDSITLNGSSSDDHFLVNFASGSIDRPISINGLGDSSTGDRLTLLGGSFESVVHSMQSPGVGAIALDDTAIDYSGLEATRDITDTVTREFSFLGGGELVTLDDDGDAADGESAIRSTQGTSTTFATPSDSVIVRTTAGSGADFMYAVGLDSGFDASLQLFGDSQIDEADQIRFFQTVSLNGGSLVASANSIGVHGTIDVGGVGEIQLAATRSIAVSANGSLSSLSGAIALEGNKTGSASGTFEGVTILGGVVESESGAISVIGQGGDTDDGTSNDRNRGVVIEQGARIETDSSVITILGTSSTAFDDGVSIKGAGTLVASATGAIVIEGDSTSESGDDGVDIRDGATIRSESTGPSANGITIVGESSNGEGLIFFGGTTVEAVDGSIELTGTTSGTSGLFFNSSAVVRSTGVGESVGSITLNGSSEGSGDGIYVWGNSQFSAVDADILLEGQTSGDDGIHIGGGADVTSAGSGPFSGTITIQGVSTGHGDGITMFNSGTTVTSVDGQISLVGLSEGTSGIYTSSGVEISATGSARIELRGETTGSHWGLHLGNEVLVTPLSGPAYLTAASTGAGDIVLSGLGTVYGTLGNRVWLDRDGDGIRDNEDDGIAGVAVSLLDDQGRVLQTTTTGADGFYGFVNLESGDYYVRFNDGQVVEYTTPNVGGVNDSNVTGTYGPGTTDLVSYQPEAPNLTIDAGLIGTGTVNLPPLVSLQNVTQSLPEDADTTSRIKVADIAITDDVLGSNLLSLTGVNADLFEIVGTELYLVAGAELDFETQPALNVTVQVDDEAIGGTPDHTVSLSLQVTDVDEGPVLQPESTIAGFVNGRWWVSRPDASGNYTSHVAASGPASSFQQTLQGDFNGDGYDDLAVWLHNGEWRVGLSDGDGNFTFTTWTTWAHGEIKEIHVGDFNGDGQDDIIGLFKQANRNRGTWWVGVSDGTRFLNRSWGDYGNYEGIETVLVGNFDGVKGDDLTVVATSGVVWMVKTSNTRFQYLNSHRWNLSNGFEFAQVGNFNGDTRDDVLAVFGTGRDRHVVVAKSTGASGGFTSGLWSTWTVNDSLSGVVVGDFDGDGRDNVAGLFNGTNVWYGESTGQRFRMKHWLDWRQSAGRLHELKVGDSNGDGLSDIFARAVDGQWHSAESTGSSFVNRPLAGWYAALDWQYVHVGRFASPLTPPVAETPESRVAAPTNKSRGNDNFPIADRWGGHAGDPTSLSSPTEVSSPLELSLVTGDESASNYDEYGRTDLLDYLSGMVGQD